MKPREARQSGCGRAAWFPPNDCFHREFAVSLVAYLRICRAVGATMRLGGGQIDARLEAARAAMPPLRWCSGFEISTKRAAVAARSLQDRQEERRHAGRARIHFRPRRRLVVRPALSAVVAHLAVLGWQY